MIVTLQVPDKARVIPPIRSRVAIGDKLFEVQKKEKIVINVARELKIKPKHIFQYLDKIIGESVVSGDIIATKKTLLGKQQIYSQYDGVVTEIDHMTGEVAIASFQVKKTNLVVASFFNGMIIENNGAVIKVEIGEGQSFKMNRVNNDFGGQIFYFNDEHAYFTISEDEIENRVIMIENIKNHIEAKCLALDVAGVVFVGGKSYSDIPQAQTSSSETFKKLVKIKSKFILVSKPDEVAILYN